MRFLRSEPWNASLESKIGITREGDEHIVRAIEIEQDYCDKCAVRIANRIGQALLTANKPVKKVGVYISIRGDAGEIADDHRAFFIPGLGDSPPTIARPEAV